jgi:hypothetical protein
MLRRKFRVNCDTCHTAERDLKAVTETMAKREIEGSAWRHDHNHVRHTYPECVKKERNAPDYLCEH